MIRPRVLFITSHRPWPPRFGTEHRVYSQLMALENSAEVDLLLLGNYNGLRGYDFYRNRNIADIIPYIPGVKRCLFWSSAKERFGQRIYPYIPAYNRLFEGGQKVRLRFTQLLKKGYDLVYYIRPETYWYLGRPEGTAHVIDIDDVQSLHAQHGFKKERHLLMRLVKWLRYLNIRRTERVYMNDAAVCLVCSREDAHQIKRADVEVFPNTYPSAWQKKAFALKKGSNRMLFVGTLRYGPNRSAMEFFVENVLPVIRDEVPDAVLDVVGSVPENEQLTWSDNDGVNLLGRVEDISQLLMQSAISVAPLREGLGTRIKILEALSHGMPVVATTIGAYGIKVYDNDGLFRKDDPGGMALVCIRLLRSHEYRRFLGKKAVRRVETMYGRKVLKRRMAEILRRIESFPK